MRVIRKKHTLLPSNSFAIYLATVKVKIKEKTLGKE